MWKRLLISFQLHCGKLECIRQMSVRSARQRRNQADSRKGVTRDRAFLDT
jgi:hypothetical protein